MKKDPSLRASSPERLPIPSNRTEPLPLVQREFAELLAQIAFEQLRAQDNATQGDFPHE